MRRRSRRAFTLVELLVVIGIIGVLISILFPVLARVRRRAVLLVSPVAFVGTDLRVHLTDPTGGYDTRLPVAVAGQTVPSPNRGYDSCPACHSPPAWSPSGLLIGMPTQDRAGYYPAVVDPLGPTVKRFDHLNGRGFFGWLDSSRLLVSDENDYYEVNTATPSRITPAFPRRDHIYYIAPTPVGSAGPYIASLRIGGVGGSEGGVAFLGRDLTTRKVIWRDRTASSRQSAQWPRVDDHGQLVGWTTRANGKRRAAWKAVGDPARQPPTLVGLEYEESCFCDWTDQGQILANVKTSYLSAWKLVTLDREGRLIRELSTDIPPEEGVIASWRRYTHQ